MKGGSVRTFIQRYPVTSLWTAAMAALALVVEWVSVAPGI
jgi:hypothetical protein